MWWLEILIYYSREYKFSLHIHNFELFRPSKAALYWFDFLTSENFRRDYFGYFWMHSSFNIIQYFEKRSSVYPLEYALRFRPVKGWMLVQLGCLLYWQLPSKPDKKLHKTAVLLRFDACGAVGCGKARAAGGSVARRGSHANKAAIFCRVC